MSYISLLNLDNFIESNSGECVFKKDDLDGINENYRYTFLRIEKKAILGTNFIRLGKSFIPLACQMKNMFKVNVLLFVIYQLIQFEKNIIDHFDKNETEFDSTKLIKDSIIFCCFEINSFIAIMISYLTFIYKSYKYKIINYIQKFTQISIERENKLIKNKYYCEISAHNNFKIEIYRNNIYNNIYNSSLTNDSASFYVYVINIPNNTFDDNSHSYKFLLQKEREIIDIIRYVQKEIEKINSRLYAKLFIFSFLIYYIPLIILFSSYENIFIYILFFSFLIEMILLNFYLYYKIKKEIIENIFVLNNNIIINGYYIYINDYIISIFYLIEKYRNKESIDMIRFNINKLLNKFNLD